MNKNLTEIVFILDRSGSMSGLESDTIRRGRSRSHHTGVRRSTNFPNCFK